MRRGRGSTRGQIFFLQIWILRISSNLELDSYGGVTTCIQKILHLADARLEHPPCCCGKGALSCGILPLTFGELNCQVAGYATRIPTLLVCPKVPCYYGAPPQVTLYHAGPSHAPSPHLRVGAASVELPHIARIDGRTRQ